MKLYRIQATGLWAATQSEARQMAGRGGKFKQVDVPTSDGREALAAFLNELAPHPGAIEVTTMCEAEPRFIGSGPPINMASVAAEVHGLSYEERAARHRLEERAALMGTKREVADIAEQIMDMEGEALGQCALAVASRFKSLAL
jgi:hypothetical protein